MKRIFLGLALMGVFVVPRSWAQTASPAKQELVKVENEWKRAVAKRDVVALERLYADEYVSTDQEGMVWNKAQDIAIGMTGPFLLASYKLDDMKVRLYCDVAVVTGRNTSEGTLLGKAASGQTRFTDVFVKRDGRWQCVASQVTASSGW